MQGTKKLQEIRSVWIERVSMRLARGEHVRASLISQLDHFFDLLVQAVYIGDPAWLNNILDEWVDARTQTELEQLGPSITPILDYILIATYESIREKFNGDEGLALLGKILPIYTYAFDYLVKKETKRHIRHITNELENARIKMEDLDKSKSDFIAVAAHELKTPLTLIEGYTSMLKDQFRLDEYDSPGRVYLEGMQNGINRLQVIINDMIDVSLIDNDMLKLNFQPIWIKQLLELSRHELTPYALERSQTFEVVFFDGSEQMTYGDPERLYQAIRNILTNAIKYTPDGGRITVSGRKLPGFVEITIADTGIGIDEAYHEQIFEKFGRLNNVKLHSSGKTKFKGGGPGLGLPITKGLIEAHGGTIWVESEGYDEEKLHGTTFHILLPILKEPPDKKYAKLLGSPPETFDENEVVELSSN